VDITAASGGVLALLGPNGAGKPNIGIRHSLAEMSVASRMWRDQPLPHVLSRQ
jgi:ABC-type hemin transport system ATPase subunit